MARAWIDPNRNGDYEYIGDGPAIRLVVPPSCDYGHPIGDLPWTHCPRCTKMTNIYKCREPGCTGARTSLAHELDCPRGSTRRWSLGV